LDSNIRQEKRLERQLDDWLKVDEKWTTKD